MANAAGFSAAGWAWRAAVATVSIAWTLATAAAVDAPPPPAARSDSPGADLHQQGDASGSRPVQPESRDAQPAVDARELVRKRMEICRRSPEVCMQSGAEHFKEQGTEKNERGGMGRD